MIKHYLGTLLCVAFLFSVNAQTNPTEATLPLNISFGTTNFTPPAANMAAWTGSGTRPYTTQAVAEASAPGADAGTFNTTPVTTNSGGQYGHAVSGDGRLTILQSSNTTNGTTQAALAIKTTGASAVTVSYDLSLYIVNPRDIGIALQYRVGTGGGFTTVAGSAVVYSNTSSNGGDADGPTDLDNYSFSLPAAALNAAVVQLRWITWNPAGSGSRSGISLDNIIVTGGPALPACAEPSAQPTNLTFVTTPTVVNGSFTVVPNPPSTIERYLIVRSLTTSLSADPVDGTTYTPGAIVNGGNGVSLGTTDDGTFTDNGRTPNTLYYYFIFSMEDVGCSGGPNYLQAAPLSGNVTTPPLAACVAPSSAPLNLMLNPGNTNISGTFDAVPSANRYLTVISLNNSLSASPANGTAYTTGQALGGGTVVSYSSAMSFNATGLTANTTYFIYVFAANSDCTGEPFYNTAPLTGTMMTTNTPNGIPAGYYDAAVGLSCQPLKTALRNIVSNGYVTLSYTPGVWNAYQFTDLRQNDANTATIVWDMYSDNPTGPEPYTFTYGPTTSGGNQCGNYTNEGDCYNREHSTPQSFFVGGTLPMYSDLNHVFPTDGKVNAYRSNYPYGEVTSATTTSLNGSKLGTGTNNFGYSGIVFEPIDAYKGDFARAGLYMATRYENEIIANNWAANGAADALFLSTTDKASSTATGPATAAERKLQIYDEWQIKLLMKWHLQDPVSQKEVDRNNAIYYQSGQANRNPFIDHPEYAAQVFDCSVALPVTLLSATAEKVKETVVVNWVVVNETSFKQYEIERSTDTRNFSRIGAVASQNIAAYSYTDNFLPNTNIVYYRLKLVDIDGRFTYSDVMPVKLNNNFSNAQVYPNPTYGPLSIKLGQPLQEQSTVQIIDVTGRTVKTFTANSQQNIVQVDVKSLPAGRYFIQIKNNKQFIKESVVVIK